MSQRIPCVWVVASQPRPVRDAGGRQAPHYSVMDEAGARTLLNMGLQPVCFPRVAVGRLETMLSMVDGILLGCAETSVHPAHYGEQPAADDAQYDPERDQLAIPLIRLAVARGVPVIGFCRGSHEVNVALGGSLQRAQRPEAPAGAQPAQDRLVHCVPGGALERITGLGRFPAASLHAQRVRELGEGLVAEAHADDGQVEAFRWHDDRSFAWGFQFHPERGCGWHPAYGRMMNTYVRACSEHFARRAHGAPRPRQPVPA